MNTPTTHVEAIAAWIADMGYISFAEMNTFLESRGIDVNRGDHELCGEHLRQPHVGQGTTLFGPTSAEYVAIVEALFAGYPVMLMIGDVAQFSGSEEPWWVTWTGGPNPSGDGLAINRRPPVNRDVHDIADRAKEGYAVGAEIIAQTQYRLAELAGTGVLDADESKRLQRNLCLIWESLYGGTLCAVRDWDTDDSEWDGYDNTYSDGRQVITQVRVEPRSESDECWEHNSFMLGDGAPNEFPLGTVSDIAPARPKEPVKNNLGSSPPAGSLQQRLGRYK